MDEAKSRRWPRPTTQHGFTAFVNRIKSAIQQRLLSGRLLIFSSQDPRQQPITNLIRHQWVRRQGWEGVAAVGPWSTDSCKPTKKQSTNGQYLKQLHTT
jgi:hypothetical protein